MDRNITEDGLGKYAVINLRKLNETCGHPAARRFPIMGAVLMSWVPWAVLAPHEEQAKRNHGGQSLETLAGRGGLSPGEALAIVHGKPWNTYLDSLNTQHALINVVREFRAAAALAPGAPTKTGE